MTDKRNFMVVAGINTIFQEPERIAVPTGEIQIVTDFEMVKIHCPTHEIMGYRRVRIFADDVGLPFVESHNLIRAETAKGDLMRRVRRSHSQVRQIDLVEVGIVHRPEFIPPGAVQVRDGTVISNARIFQSKPFTKGASRGGTVGNRGAVAAKFVIGLPGRDMRIVPVSLCQDFDNPVALVLISLVAKTIVPPRAEFARAPFGIDGQHVGMAGQHPPGRGRGRCPQHDLQSCRTQDRNGRIQPFPIETSMVWLQPAPGEFADPDPGQANLSHAPCVVLPGLARPMFGIVASA